MHSSFSGSQEDLVVMVNLSNGSKNGVRLWKLPNVMKNLKGSQEESALVF